MLKDKLSNMEIFGYIIHFLCLMKLHHNRFLTYHSLRLKKVEAPEKCNALLIFFRLPFAHKTGEMPKNSINVSCKSDNQIA